jgi:lipoprotein-anchoring transpeptidase ErfK/SrfK
VQIYIFLDEQELDLVVGDKVAIVSPTSTGKRAGWTPLGQFEIIAKSANHRSSTYGKHVSRSGKVTRSNVDSRKTKPSAGSRFVGAPMPNFLRLTQNGIGIHAGKLPGYPASHGCIRVPLEVSSLLFEHCGVGTKVEILQNRGGVIN